MTQHTPGPWTIDIVEMLDRNPTTKATFNIRNASGQLIVTSDEGLCELADARLIVAAPDLLAELERNLNSFIEIRILLKTYRAQETVQWTSNEMRIEGTKAAIAKARVRS